MNKNIKLSAEMETHLFIIWSKARYLEKEIIKKIRQKFSILKIFEVVWNKDKFSDNLTSFYGVKLPKNSHKEEHCGNGKFLLILVDVKNSCYEERQTSKGYKVVNSSVFDAKEEFRKMTGGGHKIHSTNSLKETRHDIVLLTGLNLEDFKKKYPTTDEKIEFLERDLPAVTGYNSLEEVFYILNETVNYVVLRNFDSLPKVWLTKHHGDIDLLVDSFEEVTFLLGSRKVFDVEYRVHSKLRIGLDEVLFDFRHLKDRYYDDLMEEDILKSRILNKNGIYVPSDEMHFHSLLYHGLIHKNEMALDYALVIKALGEKMNIFDGDVVRLLSKKSEQIALLDKWMINKGYRYTRPIDKSVIFNERNIGNKRLILRQKLSLKDFLSFHIRANKLFLYLLRFLPNIFRIKIRFGGLFKIDVSLGKIKDF